ncbi:MAG: hypothetical protein IJR23_04940, partial [Lachnospiraceae bacterium]|nr:hypothetical protein [Lachnospiraceae bacterium]
MALFADIIVDISIEKLNRPFTYEVPAALLDKIKIGDQVLASYRITIIHTLLGTAMSLFVMTMYAYVIAQKRFV